MTALPHRTGVFTLAIRNYWWMSTLGGFYFVGGFLAWGGSRGAVVSSGLFLAGAVLGLLVHYLARVEGRVLRIGLILAHQLLGQAVLVWQQAYLPLSDYSSTGDPADRAFLIYLVSSLIVVTMSMFGGLVGAVLGLTAHYGFIFDVNEPFTFKWTFPVLIALVGNIIATAFWQLDEAYDRLEELANHDALTGLLNRHRLPAEYERLQARATETARPLLLVAWDLDDLKPINDARGHAAGDAHLRDFARALRAHVRLASDARSDDAAFRVGGDEFLSLHLDAPDGEVLIDRLHQLFPAVSAGWVRCEGLTLDQALTQADDALYASKERRKALTGRPRAQRA